MSGIRTVSFFGPGDGEPGAGLTEVDNGLEEDGGFDDDAPELDEAGVGAAPVSRTGN